MEQNKNGGKLSSRRAKTQRQGEHFVGFFSTHSQYSISFVFSPLNFIYRRIKFESEEEEIIEFERAGAIVGSNHQIFGRIVIWVRVTCYKDSIFRADE